MVMVQGVRQVPPSDDRASAPPGFDWTSSSVVVGFGFNESKPGTAKELQAASPKPHITRAKARSSFMVRIPARPNAAFRPPAHRFAPPFFLNGKLCAPPAATAQSPLRRMGAV